MFINSIKSILAVGIIASGAAITTTSTVSASSNLGIYIGSSHGNGIGFSNVKHKRHGIRRGHGIRKHHRFGHRNRGRGCGPRHALNKAHRAGVNRPHVARINHKKIVVAGYSRGYPAKVVFKRGGHGCIIIKTRGLR